MTVMDTREAPVSYEDCYQRYTNPAAAHQIRFKFDKPKTYIVPSCNCGEIFTKRRPDVAGALRATLDEYALHVMQVVTA